MKIIDTDELRKIEFDILSFVADFCDKNNITYYLCGGTMLGAVRHNGFIPWDDDIDIMLMRDDYERLIASFPVHDYYKIIDNRIDSNYPFAFATVNDIRTYKYERKLRKKFTDSLCVNIDVFPIDTLPENEEERVSFYRRIRKEGNLLKCATDCYGCGIGFFGTIRKNLAISLFRICEFLHIVQAEKIVEDFRLLAQKYTNVKSNLCGITSIAHYGTKEVNYKTSYSSIKHMFEGKMFNIISGYDTYLSQLYGDNYMTIPPIEMQKTHHVSDCYWRNEC